MNNWRKSSYSGDGGSNCIEVADNDTRVLVRDTKDLSGPTLRFSPDAWRMFAEQVKRSLALGAADSLEGALSRLRVPLWLDSGEPWCWLDLSLP